MGEELLIVFVKSLEIGKVKTRLAKDVGDEMAYKVYEKLLNITEEVVATIDSPVWVMYTEQIDEEGFNFAEKYKQVGDDLGERMYSAFEMAFQKGFSRVVLIGSDLPDLDPRLIESAYKALEEKDFVFGPSEDGGYYLIGMNQLRKFPFENKKWSTKDLLEVTEIEVLTKNYSLFKLEVLNDIDTWEDYKKSSLYPLA